MRPAQGRELTERKELLRAWRAWHREELERVLAGPHGEVFAGLMALLKDLNRPRPTAWLRSSDQ